MKTSILQLEAHDDVISTRDKMAWSKSARILLVWPRRGRILRRRVDLVLLHRRGQELGAQIALVTRDREVNLYARELGIPVFSSVRQAESRPWRARPRRTLLPRTDRKPRDRVELRQQYTEFHRLPSGFLQLPITRSLIFLLGVLAVCVLILFFIPSARVELSPLVKEQAITLSVRAGPSIPAVNASGALPAEPVSVVVEGQAEIQSTGRMRVPDAHSGGTVLLANLTSAEVLVPAGSVVRTSSSPAVRFETLSEVKVPAGPGQTVEAPVRALLPGTEGNLSVGQIVAVEGDLGLRVSVSNPQPLQGGTERSIRTPSIADETRLREQLLANLRENALKDLARMAAGDRDVIPSSLVVSKVVTEERTPPESQPSDRLQIRMQVEYTAWTVRMQDLRVLAQAALSANLEEGFQVVPETLSVSRLTEPVLDADAQQAGWQIRAVEQVRTSWSADEVVRWTAGKTPSEAGAVIARNIQLQTPPRITLRPSWWQRLPYVAFRIQVVAP